MSIPQSTIAFVYLVESSGRGVQPAAYADAWDAIAAARQHRTVSDRYVVKEAHDEGVVVEFGYGDAGVVRVRRVPVIPPGVTPPADSTSPGPSRQW